MSQITVRAFIKKIKSLVFLPGLILVIMGFPQKTFAQQSEQKCSDQVGDFQGYTVRSLKIVPPRWSKSLTLDPVTPDEGSSDLLAEKEEFTTEKLGNTMTSARKAYKKLGESKNLNLFERIGSFEVISVPPPCVSPVSETDCQKINKEKCVDVSIRPYRVGVDIYRIGKNILLPIPRSNLPTALSKVPKPLKILNPTFGINYDREFGTAIQTTIETDLLHPLENKSETNAESDKLNLRLSVQGDKSLTNKFYRSRVSLALGHKLTETLWENASVEGHFNSYHEPFGNGERFSNQGRLGINLTLRPSKEFFNSITFNANYRYSNNRFFSNDSLEREAETENALELRTLIDGRLKGGFSRLGLWFDANHPNNSTSYKRLAGLFGYSKEIPIKLNQTIGLEFLAGGGRIWGDAPEYSRFHSGNSLSNFLYAEQRDELLTNFPTGPLLRSIGNNQGNTVNNKGGTSFWHFNLNASFPLPSFSRPLIPNENIGDEDDSENVGANINNNNNLPKPCQSKGREEATLKTLVKSSVRSSFNIIRRLYISQGMTPDQAQKAAEKDIKEICPGVFYLADYANIYAVKPLFMFDASHLASSNNLARTRYAIGGGLQFVLVTTRFEIGYMKTLRPLVQEQKGNFVFRLTFQNLF